MNKKLREKVWLKYDKHCAYCGQVIEYKDMQVDHLVPKINPYSTEDFDNLMPSCRSCNHYKRAEKLDSFRNHLLGELHLRLTKEYTVKVAIDYGIVKLQPFDKVFYFEKVSKQEERITDGK